MDNVFLLKEPIHQKGESYTIAAEEQRSCQCSFLHDTTYTIFGPLMMELVLLAICSSTINLVGLIIYALKGKTVHGTTSLVGNYCTLTNVIGGHAFLICFVADYDSPTLLAIALHHAFIGCVHVFAIHR